MVEIPGGEFVMGAPEDEEGSDDSERPQHQVTIAPFLMSQFLVTQLQWETIMGTNPFHFKGENRPVEQVSWYKAIDFCQKLSQKIGMDYRLPSEAEWEYACRAGTTTPYHFGETITPELANFRSRETSDVGSYSPNAFGLYDMHGNVFEWCQDHRHGNYEGAPRDGSAWIESGDDSLRIIRGGSWLYDPRNCRSAYRYYYAPADRGGIIGFRVVCSAPSPLQ